jgi:hypothetical protein
MNRLQAISKRLLTSNISKRIIAATVRLGIFIFLFATSSAASALEAIAKLLGKALQDNASATDAPSKAITKPATDGSEVLDGVALNAALIKQETTQGSELVSLAALLNKEHLSNAEDDNLLLIGKNSSDSPSTADQQFFDVAKQITETIGATDDINGADVDDDQNIVFFKVTSNSSSVVDVFEKVAAYLRSFSNTAAVGDVAGLSVGRPLTDTSAMSESEVKLAGLGKTDTMAASDAGELLNQDYVDNPNYFLDDYVGVKRTF